MKHDKQPVITWTVRILVIGSCILMLTSFAFPWWQVSRIGISSLSYNGTITKAISIYGFGLRHSMGQLASYLVHDVTPVYQTVMAWSYVALSGCLAIIATFLKGWKGSLLLALVGISYIVYALAADYVISQRLTSFGLEVRGHSIGTYSGAVIDMQSNFTNSYYLAFVAGGLFIVFALLYPLLKNVIGMSRIDINRE